MKNDDRLDAAVRALRRRTEAPAEAPQASRRRIVAALAQRKVRRENRRWIYAAAAATLFAVSTGTTAWAAATGRLSFPALWHLLHHEAASVPASHAPALDSHAESRRPESPPSTQVSPSLSAPAPAPVFAAPVVPAAVAPAAESTHAPAAVSPVSDAPVRTVDTDALFREAHQAHFVRHDPHEALRAWDRYLRAAPHGRFAVEAQYNRALDLIRLGRLAEATSALRPFADGVHGAYRRHEAQSLLDAMARRGNP